MKESVQKTLDFFDGFRKSGIYDAVAPKGNAIRDDLLLMELLCKGALDQGALTMSDADSLDSALTTLCKAKRCFHSCMTIFPVGVHIAETVTQRIVQSRQDEILRVEMKAAGEHASSLLKSTVITLKEKDSDIEINIANVAKMADVFGKAMAFKKSASNMLKAVFGDEMKAIEELKAKLACEDQHRGR